MPMSLPDSLRDDFPILSREVRGQPCIYLDSAATSLKPRAVIDAVTGFYTTHTANVHRSVHLFSEEATEAFESTRELLAQFLNCDRRELAFTRNATEALNIVAMAHRNRGPVGLTLAEHHSNLLPWQQGDHFFFPLDDEHKVDLDKAAELIATRRPHLVTIASISNALGVRHPVEALVSIAREHGCLVMVDLSQSVGHEPVDLFELDCDYACFSSHKMLGPSGVGVLFQREGLESPIESHYLGGEMIHQAHIDGFEPRPFPWGLEAGTPNIEGVIGLGAAVDYLDGVGVPAIQEHAAALATSLKDRLRQSDGIELVVDSPAAASTGIVTFRMAGLQSQGLARILSQRFNIMIRSGFHCAQPLHESLSLQESARASFHLYNTDAEVEALVDALYIIRKTA